MMTDAQARLLNARAITAAGTYTSDAYDTGTSNTPARNIGRGQPLRLKVGTNTTFVGGTGLVLNYIQSANADLSSPDILASVTPASPTPAAGTTLWDIHLPQNTKRYVGVSVVTTGTNTAGAVDANIVSDTDSSVSYTSNLGR